MTKKDCFAYSKHSSLCRILKKRYCDNGECGFYKSKKQFSEDLKKYPPYDYKHYTVTGQKIDCNM